jgi:hypothetical protein
VDRPDHPLVTPAVVDRLAYQLDPAGDRRRAHVAGAPHLVEELVLGHHAVALADQVRQDRHHLGLDAPRLPADPDLTGGFVDLDVPESVYHDAILAPPGVVTAAATTSSRQ